MKDRGERVRLTAIFLLLFFLLQTYLVGAVEQVDWKEIGVEEDEIGEHTLLHEGAFVNVHYSVDEISVTAQGDWRSEVRRRFLAAAASGQELFDVEDLQINRLTDSEDVRSFLDEVVNQNPQYFYVRYACCWTYYINTNQVIKIKIYYRPEYCKEDGSLDMEKVNADSVLFELGIEDALSYISKDMSDLEKVLVIHDWLVRECDYDIENYEAGTLPNWVYSPIGAFVYGSVVCQGYAETMSFLLQKLGIDSYVVGSSEMNHAWNIVCIDGSWFHIDATWDDPIMWTLDKRIEGYVAHIYFLKSDKEMREELNHDGWADTVPRCDKSGSYEGYLFRDYLKTAFSYSNGYWFFKDNENKNICKALLNGQELEKREILENLISVFVYNGELYYATEKQVQNLSIDAFLTDTPRILDDLASENPGYLIQAFAIQKGKLFVKGFHKAENLYIRKYLDLYEMKIPYSLGDVDGDGKSTPTDAMFVLRAGSKLLRLSQSQQLAADVDGDGRVTPADAMFILRKSSKLISKFPAES